MKDTKEFELKFNERGHVVSQVPVHLSGQEIAIRTFGEPNEKSVRDSLNRLNDCFIYSVEKKTNGSWTFGVKAISRNGGRLDK